MSKGYWVRVFAVVGITLGVVVSANASMVTYTDSIPMLQTNWSESVTIPKFNPAEIPDFDPVLGSLDSIIFTLTGNIDGRAGFESRDNSTSTVTLDLSAIIRLQRPDSSDIWFSTPTVTRTDSVDPFDDIIDFAGDSGRTYENLIGSMTGSLTSSIPSDLILFTGSGNITLPVTAKGVTGGTGAGNLVLFFETKASADVEVAYEYTIPEPVTILFLAFGFLALLRRQRIWA